MNKYVVEFIGTFFLVFTIGNAVIGLLEPPGQMTAGEVRLKGERIDTLERLLQEKNVLGADDVEDYEPDEQVMASRMKWHKDYIARILRIIQTEIDAIGK